MSIEQQSSPSRQRKAPRYQGRIGRWNEERGFGFIEPNGGGPAVFLHVSAFTDRASRPAAMDIVTYRLEADRKGPRAAQVALVRGQATRKTVRLGPAGAPAVAAAFLGLVALCVLSGKLPSAVLGLYLGGSVLAFLAYAADKSAARSGGWRTSERTLHLLGLAGGWPGALLAQRLLRHKSSKASFRTVFRATVLVNCAAFAWLLTPSGARMLRDILGTP